MKTSLLLTIGTGLLMRELLVAVLILANMLRLDF
jgi:hypothetical protein